MIIGAILAAGKGTRINSHTVNKTTLPFNGKPLIDYAAKLFRDSVDETVVVVNAFKESVINALFGYRVRYVDQGEPLGTGHAVQVVIDDLQKRSLFPTQLVVGYGDHMMFYTPAIVRRMILTNQHRKAAVTLITTYFDDPDALGLGRVVRGGPQDHITKIIEQKEATEKEREIKELNAGFYCFDYRFLLSTKDKINKSAVTGEYYINEFIGIAIAQKKLVLALKTDFKYVGIGVNTKEQLKLSQGLFKLRKI